MHYSTPQPTKKRVAFDILASEHEALAAKFPYLARSDNDKIDWRAAVQALLAGAQGHDQARVQL